MRPRIVLLMLSLQVCLPSPNPVSERMLSNGLKVLVWEDHDIPNVALADNILGGRFTSMLNERLRVKAGLTYGAYSYLQQDRLNGAIALHSYTATADTRQAIDLALEVLRHFVRAGVSADQVAAARTYLESTYPAEHLQTAAQLAALLGEMELYGLGREEVNRIFSRLNEITVGQTNHVVRKYYAQAPLVLVVLGRAAQLRKQLADHAEYMAEASIRDPGFARPAQSGRASRSQR